MSKVDFIFIFTRVFFVPLKVILISDFNLLMKYELF